MMGCFMLFYVVFSAFLTFLGVSMFRCVATSSQAHFAWPAQWPGQWPGGRRSHQGLGATAGHGGAVSKTIRPRALLHDDGPLGPNLCSKFLGSLIREI